MKVIRFEVEGALNSYRVPYFRKYHKTFLAPPKTTIIGLLCNISLKTQKDFFEILNNDLVKVSVVIDEIKGKAKDLWRYKTLKSPQSGKRRDSSIIRRDKLFLPKYTIYLFSKNAKLLEEFEGALKYPQNIPSLGLDDELIVIKNTKSVELIENDSKRINSVFMGKEIEYKVFVKDINKFIEIPTLNLVPTKFIAFNKGKRISKQKQEELFQIEFLNCEVEVDMKSYFDKEKNNRIVFY